MTSFSPDDLSLGASPQALRALIESRRAVRRFLPEAVPDAVIRDCLELAVLAPNSCNLQPWSFQVVRDPALLARLHPVCMSQNAAKAPLIIAVLAALLAYRALYYFVPLVLASLALGAAELRWRHSAAAPAKN